MSHAQARQALDFGRDWAGLLQQGRILISVDRVRAGYSFDEILSHESVHDVLLKSTQLGWTQLALSQYAADPWPDGELRNRCAQLLGASIVASRLTHEGTATFVPSLDVAADALPAYRSRHPADYVAASDGLEWLRSRDLPAQAKRELAFAAGTLALSVPVLEEWRPRRLYGPDELARWLAQPAVRPDRRFPVLCRRLAELSDAELEQVAAGGLTAAAQVCADVTLEGATPSFAPQLGHESDLQWLSELVQTVLAPLAGVPGIAVRDVEALQEALARPWLSVPGLQPTLLTVVVTRTTLTHGSFDPKLLRTAELHGYPLVHVLHNMLDRPVPGVEPVGGRPVMVQEGESALWLVSPAKEHRACHLSPGRLREWLDGLDDDTTLCIRDGAFFFGVPIGEPRLRGRRHLVLVQNRTPAGLLSELRGLGLDEQRTPVAMTVLESEHRGLVYLLLRPKGESPVVVLPTAKITAGRMVEALSSDGGRVSFSLVWPQDFFSSRRMTIDVRRVLADFEDAPWAPELVPQTAAPPPARGDGTSDDDAVEPLVEESATAWANYERDRTATTFAVLASSLDRVLDSPLLESASLARRVEILEDAAGCFYVHFDSNDDVEALRRCIVIRRRLLEILPEDWPGRLRQVGLTGQCQLRLWSMTGEQADRVEALRLLREGRVPGFE